MRRCAAFLLSILLLLLIAGTAPALAQVPSGECNGAGSIPGTYSLTPDSGPAGSGTTLTGDIPLATGVGGTAAPGEPGAPGGPVPDTVGPGGVSVETWWLETGFGDAVPEGTFEITIGSSSAHFSGSFNIPATAAPGPHQVAFLLSGATDPNCLVFTVTQSVQQNAYTQTAALPDTGFFLIVPAAGLAAAASGVAIMRRKRI